MCGVTMILLTFLLAALESDEDQNLHFTINAAMEQDDMLHMAESVSLSEMTK